MMFRPVHLVLALCMLAMPADAASVGDDGLHKADWMRTTFLDLSEDLEEANAEGKRMMILFEQRGCIYCEKMHREVFPREEVASFIRDNFFVVQLNLHGDRQVVDLDGERLSEKQAARKWGLLFTPTMLFLPEQIDTGQTAAAAAVATMPGAFGWQTTLDLLTWVTEKRYEDREGEDFQRYHARRIEERNSAQQQ